MKNCIFCKLQKLNDIIIENKYFYAIFDLNPVSIGHTLIIPKRHILSIEDLNENEANSFFEFQNNVVEKIKTINLKEFYNNILKNSNEKNSINFTKKILHKFVKFNWIKDYNLWINNWIFAWRTVNHLHIHIIPRYKWDVKDYVWGVRHIIPELGNYKNFISKKLVRDNIPEIIKNTWIKPDYYISEKNEYKDELFKKLLEETKEVIEEKNNIKNLKEELWDLLEVFESILKLENIEMSEIIKIKESKNKKNWWFNKRIILNLN